MKCQHVVLMPDRNLFCGMNLVAENKSVYMKGPDQPIGPNAMGTGKCRCVPTKKTNKAALARRLENSVSPAEAIRTPSTCIIDGMGLAQRMNGNNKTIAQLAESVMSMVLYVDGQCGRVDVVFDVYRQPSIIYSERLNRGASTTLQYKCLAAG